MASMSATDSLVVKSPRAGPSCNAQRSISSVLVWALAASALLLRAAQLSGSDVPVPRWSNSSRSRVASAGEIASAMNGASGSTAWPGPPASATTASRLGAAPASLRPMPSEIVPGSAPLRSSGTASDAQENPGLSAQGRKLRLEDAAEDAGKPASRIADSRAARAVKGARLRIDTDNSCRGIGVGGELDVLAAERADQHLAAVDPQRAVCGGVSTDPQIDGAGGDRAEQLHAGNI